MISKKILFAICFLLTVGNASTQSSLSIVNNNLRWNQSGREYIFKPSFTILFNETDPGLALKPANLAKVSYNVPTWKTNDSTLADYKQKNVSDATAGDGFDDRILRSKREMRTANIYHAGKRIDLTAIKSEQKGDSVYRP
ncbi:MAG: hypothetical protein EOO39_13235 [Cytophagaceae bacterium]|nr:MAG: hypothetical protein EOO39_13235 [Cytophagaceae bacterium]